MNACLALANYKCVIGKKLSSRYLEEQRITLKCGYLFNNLDYIVYMTCRKYKTEPRIRFNLNGIDLIWRSKGQIALFKKKKSLKLHDQ